MYLPKLTAEELITHAMNRAVMTDLERELCKRLVINQAALTDLDKRLEEAMGPDSYEETF